MLDQYAYSYTSIKIQIPIVISLIFIVFQAANLLGKKEFKLIALGWTVNLIYLLFYLFFHHAIFINERSSQIISTVLDLVCIFIFFLAIRPYSELKLFDFLRKTPLPIIIICFIGAGYLKCIQGTPEGAPIIFKNIPAVSIDAFVLFSLAQYYKSLRGEYSKARFLVWGSNFYAIIQILALINSESFSKNTIIYSSIDDIGFSLGLLSKLIILITFTNLLMNIVKKFTEAKNELLNQTSFAEKLNQIIGRTFHEITPALKEMENKISILSEENAAQQDYQINKKARRVLDVIDGDVNRVMTILSASTRMYYFDALKLDPDNIDLPIPIEPEIDVHSINMIIEIAITNLKTLIALSKNPDSFKKIHDNFYVTNDVKFKTEYGGNCNVLGNTVELVQIFYNIFKNCYEASEGYDYICNIFVKTKNITEEIIDNDVTKRIKSINIEIEDNGPGIPDKILSAIFEEGFTTKNDRGGRGRGFGLAIVKSYTEKYGGKIIIESPIKDNLVSNLSDRPGTKFQIILPKQYKN